MSFIRSLRSEALKLISVRSTLILAIVLFVYAGAYAAGFGALLGVSGDQGNSPIQAGDDTLAPFIYSMASSFGYVFPVLLGALAVTGEFRHQTLTPTFLATPRRGVVIGAKLLIGFVAGAVYGIIGALATVGLGAPILAAGGFGTALDDPETWALIARIVLAMGLWGIVGVGLGSLIPNQVAVIVVVLAFTQFLEPTLRVAAGFIDGLSGIGQFLPGAASDALVGASFFALFAGGGGDSLEKWQGGLVLFAIGAVLSVIGALTTWRRDVT